MSESLKHSDLLAWLEQVDGLDSVYIHRPKAVTSPSPAAAKAAAPGLPSPVVVPAAPFLAASTVFLLQLAEADERNALLLESNDAGSVLVEVHCRAVHAALKVDSQRQIYLQNRTVIRTDLIKELSESNANLRQQLRDVLEMVVGQQLELQQQQQRQLSQREREREAKRLQIEAAVKKALNQ